MHQRVRELWLRAVPPNQRKLAIILASLLVVYTLVGFLVVPWIVKGQIQKQAPLRLHRQASVQKVRFNPYTFETRLIGFDLWDRDGTPLVAWDTLLVNFDLVSLVDRAWVLHEIRLVRPVLVARILKDRSPAIADLVVPDSTTPVVHDTTPSRPPRLKIDLLSVRAGEIEVVNEARTPTYQTKLEDLGLTLERFSTLPAEEGDHYLTVSFASGAEIKWAGKEVMQPLDLSGRLVVSRLHPARIAEALAPDLPLAPTSGEMGGSFSYEISQARDGHFILALSDATLTIKDLAVRPKDAKDDWFKVGAIEARGLKSRWPDRVATLDLLRIADLWLTATRKADSTISWMPYLRAMQARDSGKAKPAPTDTTAPWSGSVTAIEVDSGTVHLEDETVTPKVALDISRIQVRLDTVGTDPKARTGFTASLGLGKKASFSTKGTVVRQPFGADFDLGLTDLDLSMGQPYLGPNPPIYIAGGLASIKGKVRMRETRPKILFEGVAGISGLVINDTSKAPLLTWKDTRVKGIRRTSDPDLLRIKTIEVEQPFARIAISRDRQTNLAPLLSLSPRTTTEEKEAYHYEISQVLFKDAEIDFSDESLILPFRTRIHSTQGAIRDVASFGGTPGTLELEGKIDEYGLARANGTLHASDPYSATSIKAEFRNLDMPRLTPYTAEFLGYAIKEGRLDVDMDYKIQNRELHAEHHVVAKNMQLGEKIEGSSGPPGFAVKLAVSLLKDRQGNIKLDPLVTGTVDDPHFSYSKIIWQSVKQILGKIASAPFHFLGKLFGGGEAPELVEFDAGRTDVIPPEREKLDSLAATLQEKPELTLSIEGRYDSVADAAALREAKLKSQIEAQRDSTATKTQKSDTGTVLSVILENLYIRTFSRPALDSLRAAFTATPGGAPAPVKETKDNKKKQAPPPPPPVNGFNATGYYDSLRAQLLAAQPVERTELVQLGKDRADSIMAALTATKVVDSSRIAATDPAPASKKKSGSSRVASEMKMDAK